MIPKPLAVAPGRGVFELGPSARILVRAEDPEAVRVARSLAERLRPATGYRLPVSATRRKPVAGDVVLALAPGDRSLGDEGYRLRVEPGLVRLDARTAAGLFHAAQTLRQLLPASIEAPRRQPAPWEIGVVTIHDRPRFGWRGLMLDVARHFFDVGEVKRLIDLMALYKLNRLHLHLTDDQGWRIAVRSRPNLTRIGATTAVGGGPGGHYTRRQYAELVEHGRRRFVDVIPEVDMPGHVNAALASYRELTCDGIAPPPYTGIEVGFSSLSIRKEPTYAFLDDVLGELAALTPGRYLHVGGDEPLSTDPEDYRFFVERVQRLVRSHGKRAILWEEAARAEAPPDGGRAALARPGARAPRRRTGREARAFPVEGVYLDMKYDRDSPLGLDVGRNDEREQGVRLGPRDVVDGSPSAMSSASRRRSAPRRSDPRRSRLAGVPAAARRRRGRLVARRARAGATTGPGSRGTGPV